jgi:hypothetical protein
LYPGRTTVELEGLRAAACRGAQESEIAGKPWRHRGIEGNDRPDTRGERWASGVVP